MKAAFGREGGREGRRGGVEAVELLADHNCKTTATRKNIPGT
jgi:hypothetical protein